MNITDVRIRKLKKESKMRAVVSITVDNCFVIHDIKVIAGEKGLFVAMPSRRIGEGNYRDIAHPINSATRKMIEEEIFEVYNESIEKIEENNELNTIISEEVETV